MWTIHFLRCFEVKLFAADECRANSGQPWSVLVPRTTLLRNPKARLSSAFLDSRALTQRPLLLIDPFQFHTLNWSFKVPEHLDSKFLLSPDGPCLITKVLALPWCHKPSYNRAPTPTFFAKSIYLSADILVLCACGGQNNLQEFVLLSTMLVPGIEH